MPVVETMTDVGPCWAAEAFAHVLSTVATTSLEKSLKKSWLGPMLTEIDEAQYLRPQQSVH